MPARSRGTDVQLTPLVGGDGSVLGTTLSFADTTQLRRLQRRTSSGARESARDGVRGAAVDGRGARDDERGAPVDERGAGDDERGAPVDERGARDDERGAPVDERGARDDQRRAATAHGRAQPRRTRSSRPCCRGLSTAVLVVDDELRVRAWNGHATELWGLREDEVQGAHLPGLDIGLPVAEVAGIVTGAIDRERGGRGRARRAQSSREVVPLSDPGRADVGSRRGARSDRAGRGGAGRLGGRRDVEAHPSRTSTGSPRPS